jgi:hypothetical protein
MTSPTIIQPDTTTSSQPSSPFLHSLTPLQRIQLYSGIITAAYSASADRDQHQLYNDISTEMKTSIHPSCNTEDIIMAIKTARDLKNYEKRKAMRSAMRQRPEVRITRSQSVKQTAAARRKEAAARKRSESTSGSIVTSSTSSASSESHQINNNNNNSQLIQLQLDTVTAIDNMKSRHSKYKQQQQAIATAARNNNKRIKIQQQADQQAVTTSIPAPSQTQTRKQQQQATANERKQTFNQISSSLSVSKQREQQQDVENRVLKKLATRFLLQQMNIDKNMSHSAILQQLEEEEKNSQSDNEDSMDDIENDSSLANML